MKDGALERMMIDNMCAQVTEKTRAGREEDVRARSWGEEMGQKRRLPVAKIQRIAHSGIGSVT
jgi:hypothetical protein